jgi:hypothetical protein
MADNDQVPDSKTLSEQEAEDQGEQPIFASGARRQMENEYREYTDRSPALAGGDVDADWRDSDEGSELPGGSNPTPDQDIVEEIGEAYGLTYQDNEPIGLAEKLEKRDDNRWELDPASAEDFNK